ncbi:MAG TPA: APC family permease [Solirubrobacteraceae bacterium]|nr:APC family permease [Solirubrobacteraceae bacterium]
MDPETTVSKPSSAQAGAPEESGYFTRSSSGLVRGISLSSSVILNLSFVGLVQAILAVTLIPASFPGANPAIVTAICAVALIAPYVMYGLFTRLMPRSGGDYVFVSRALGPWAGLAASVNVTLWYAAAIAYLTFVIPQTALPSALASIGVIADSETLITWSEDLLLDGWTFLIAGLSILGIFVAASLRLNWTLRFARVLLGLAAFGVLLSIVVLLFNGRDDFVSAVSAFGGNYEEIIAAGNIDTSFDLGDTLLATSLAFFSLGFGIATAYTGGELRSSQQTAVRGMLYALAIAAGTMVVAFALASRVMGNDFLGAATNLSLAGDEAYPFGVGSNFFFFVSMLADNTIIAALLGIAFVAGAAALCIPVFLIASRSLFAWSFDRLVPEGLSHVDPRTRSPLRANVLVLVVAFAYLALMVFGSADFTIILYTQTLGLLLTFLVVSLAGVVLPYRRPDLYKLGSSDRRVLGLPLLTFVSLIALVVYGFFTVVFATQDVLAANSSTGIKALIVIAVISIVAYPVSYLINKSRGLDLSLANKTLPPE